MTATTGARTAHPGTNGLALSDQKGNTLRYFSFWYESYRLLRARAVELAADPDAPVDPAFVALASSCWKLLAVGQGTRYRVECSLLPKTRGYLLALGIAPATDDEMAALPANRARAALALAEELA